MVCSHLPSHGSSFASWRDTGCALAETMLVPGIHNANLNLKYWQLFLLGQVMWQREPQPAEAHSSPSHDDPGTVTSSMSKLKATGWRSSLKVSDSAARMECPWRLSSEHKYVRTPESWRQRVCWFKSEQLSAVPGSLPGHCSGCNGSGIY